MGIEIKQKHKRKQSIKPTPVYGWLMNEILNSIPGQIRGWHTEVTTCSSPLNATIPTYVHFRNKKKKKFVILFLREYGVEVFTRKPSFPTSIGNEQGADYRYLLNYRTLVTSEDQIPELLTFIKASYNELYNYTWYY
jgi:hypothetical protein